MNPLRYFLSILLVSVPLCAADLTGFPFQNESLRYAIKWPSGVSMGEATVSASMAENAGWRFDMNFNAGVPGFPFLDTYRSSTNAQLCSDELNRSIQHGTKRVTEKTTFDRKRQIAERRTLNPAGGGTSELQTSACPQDALAYFFLARREMGQGRTPPSARVYFGGAYDVSAQYTGAMDVTVGDKAEVSDHVNFSIKGPASDITLEVFYARDAARTPLLFKIPVSIGKISVELVRH